MYQINLEELVIDSKRLSNEYVKVSLNEKKPVVLNTLEEVRATLVNADTSHKLTTGVLKSLESKTFTLRLWMDYDTPATNDVMNASMESKVTIEAIQKEGLPEVDIAMNDNLNEIIVEIDTIENPKNEELIYFYQLNEEEEIESSEKTYTFTGLSDGKYVARGRAETLDGVILREKEMDVTIAYETVYVSSSGSDESGNGSIESPYATLQPAYNKVKSGGSILLLSDITATSTTTMDIENKEVTLRSDGEEIYSIFRGNDLTTQLLNVLNSNTVTTTNITFDGNEVISVAALIESYDSTLNLNEGTTIQNGINKNTSASSSGGGVSVVRSVLNITGASIKNNKANSATKESRGGGVAGTESTLNFYSGYIENNSTESNSSDGYGGGIYLGDSNMTMFDGAINNNTANEGAGMFFTGTQSIQFNMIGGTITNNTAAKKAGGLFVRRLTTSSNPSIAYLKGGSILNNVAPVGANTYTQHGAQIIVQR